MPSSKRTHLIETALRLFNAEGFHATGIDKILEEAGVARMTLYNNFKSKEELIIAALDLKDEQLRTWLEQDIEQSISSDTERPIALFNSLSKWLHSEDFYGCTFVNAAAEYSELSHPIHKAAVAHKANLATFIEQQLIKSNIPDIDFIKDSFFLLIHGAIIMHFVAGDKEAGNKAKKAALALLPK